MNPQKVINIVSCISDYRYLAMDQDEKWFLFKEKPHIHNSEWQKSYSDSCLASYFDFAKIEYTGDWTSALFEAESMSAPIQLINNRMTPQYAINLINKFDSRFKWIGRNGTNGSWWAYTDKPSVDWIDSCWNASRGKAISIDDIGIEVICADEGMILTKTTNWFWDRLAFKFAKYVYYGDIGFNISRLK